MEQSVSLWDRQERALYHPPPFPHILFNPPQQTSSITFSYTQPPQLPSHSLHSKCTSPSCTCGLTGRREGSIEYQFPWYSWIVCEVIYQREREVERWAREEFGRFLERWREWWGWCRCLQWLWWLVVVAWFRRWTRSPYAVTRLCMRSGTPLPRMETPLLRSRSSSSMRRWIPTASLGLDMARIVGAMARTSSTTFVSPHQTAFTFMWIHILHSRRRRHRWLNPWCMISCVVFEMRFIKYFCFWIPCSASLSPYWT